jgi:hypothetical protein
MKSTGNFMKNSESGQIIRNICSSFVVLLLLLFTCCCSSGKNAIKTEIQERSFLEEISFNADSYIGKQVTIAGYFQGYGGSMCIIPERFSDKPVSSRSDCIFSNGKYCVYVTGRADSIYNPMTNTVIPAELSAYARLNKRSYLHAINITQKTVKIIL